MVATVPTAAVVGVDVVPVQVEVHIARGLPSLTIVGLPDAAVREARERVRAALASCELPLARARILVHLAPADLRKVGAGLDLPIALALLAADGRVPAAAAAATPAFGALALDGQVRSAAGAFTVAAARCERAAAAIGASDAPLLLAAQDAALAATLPAARVAQVRDLRQAVRILRGAEVPTAPGPVAAAREPEAEPDLCDVRGQVRARFALEVAAAGGHGLLLTGSPGTGKSMLARRLPGLLPDLTVNEAVEVARIRSAAGLPLPPQLPRRPPFRAPHARITPVGLLGGGRTPRPGEVSLAHRGVLFLDEVPEFARDALEGLRQPLQDGVIRIDRSFGRASLPAAFQLIAARNPCPCGHYGSESGRCRCRDADRDRNRSRLSGPLLDRIDLHVPLAALAPADLARSSQGEATAAVAARAVHARRAAIDRQGVVNARMNETDLQRAVLDRPAVRARLAAVAAASLRSLSFRSTDAVARTARTLADLAGRTSVEADDIDAAAALCLDAVA